MEEMRCEKCKKLLAYMKGEAEIKCPRCKALTYKKTNEGKVKEK